MDDSVSLQEIASKLGAIGKALKKLADAHERIAEAYSHRHEAEQRLYAFDRANAKREWECERKMNEEIAKRGASKLPGVDVLGGLPTIPKP